MKGSARLPFLLCLFLCGTDAASASESAKQAPAFTAKLFGGEGFSLAGASGQVVILHFWATWCAPCRAEMDALEAYFQKHRSEGLKLIAISMDSPKDEEKAREVMKKFSFSAAMSKDASYKGYGRIWHLPLTFVVDRKGILTKDAWQEEKGISVEILEKTVTPILQAK